MGKWTRRDVVKAGVMVSAGVVAGGEAFGDPAGGIERPAAAQAMQGSAAANVRSTRERLSMDYGWRFALGNANDPEKDFGFGKLSREGTYAKAGRVDGPAAPRFDASSWKQVELPHDWAVDLPFIDDPILVEHGGKPLGREYPETSVGWYRKEFVLPAEDAGRNISLEFDGIFRNATVFFNGHYITQNMSGYAPVALDITDFCNFADEASTRRAERQKQELASATTDQAKARLQNAMEIPGRNVLVVRVDATLDEGWFYEGAGIYRHVWLTKTSPVHIAQWGNYVRPDFGTVAGVVSGTSTATLLITTDVTNSGNDDAVARVRATILDAAGKSVATAVSEGASIEARDTRTFKLNTTLDNPKLWSLETPHLYRAVMHVESEGRGVDELVTSFGVRTVKFDANRGLLLNGKPVKIKGTCNHQDHAGVGAAIPDRIQEYRIERLQWMGSNGCRTSHNPPTPEFLDACDRKGMLVMDETRMMSSNPEGLSQLERLIKRDRNHPSVIIWSLANEEPEQGNTRGARIVNTMKRLQRKLDPSRVCTTAMNNGYGGVGVSTVVDVQGFNYNDAQIDAYHRDHPLQPIVGTETASTLATRGIYANDKTRGYMSAYDTEKPSWGNTAEEWWSFYADREWLAGGYAWTGFDYRGETTPYKWPCISSHFGILDTCGFAKDTAFYYKTWWGSEPVLHLLPHWNWAGKEGQEIEVWAYCNQDSVELFLNGASQGSQPVRKNGHLMWKVKYAPGVLEARASRAGRVTLTEKRETTGVAAKISAIADRSRIAADGRDVSVINVSILDAEGRPVPTADNKVSFAISGPASLIGVGNGDPSCHEPDHAMERSSFNGLCMGILQSRRGQSGGVTVQISSPGLEPATVSIESATAALPEIV